MSVFVEFSVPIPAMRGALSAAPEVDVVVDQQADSDANGLRWLVRAHDRGFDDFERGLTADDTVREFEVLSTADQRREYLITLDASDSERTIYACWSRHGGMFLSGRDRRDGWSFEFRFPAQQFAQQFQECCRRRAGVTVTLERLHQYDGDTDDAAFDLSDPQRAALAEALERGYFDVPRQTTLEELAAHLGVSDSATSQRLRRGLKTVVERALSTRSDADADADERDRS